MSYNYELKFSPEDYYLYDGNYLKPQNSLDNLIKLRNANPESEKEIDDLIDYVEFVRFVRIIANEMLIEINNNRRVVGSLTEEELAKLSPEDLEPNLALIYDKFFPYDKRNNKKAEADYNTAYYEALALVIDEHSVVDINKLALPEYVKTQDLFRIEAGMSDEEYKEYKEYFNMKF